MQGDAIAQPPADRVAEMAVQSVPPAPGVRPEEIWPGVPNVLLDAERYTIGWQGWPEKKGGASYVTVRRSPMGALKIVERYPLTDAGWAQAWRAFAQLDPAAAAKVLPVLARRAEAATGFAQRRELNERSLAHLPAVVFVGGYPTGGELAPGEQCELRFLADRLAVYRQGSLAALAQLPYPSVQAAEIAGPGLVHKWSPAQQAMLAAAFGVTGALVAYGSTRIKTFIRIQTADSELFFLHTTLVPEDLRIALSRALGAIRQAQAQPESTRADQPPAGTGSLGQELSRLATLLSEGLLTRDEFDQLKARLIAGS